MTRLRLARRDALGRTRIICFCAATDVAEPEKMSRDEDHSQDKLSRDQDHYPPQVTLRHKVFPQHL